MLRMVGGCGGGLVEEWRNSRGGGKGWMWRKGGCGEKMVAEGRWWMWKKCGCGGRLNVEEGWR